MNRYTHTMREQEQDAIATLPEIDLDAPGEQRATGTDGAAHTALHTSQAAEHSRTLHRSAEACYDGATANAVLTRTGDRVAEGTGLLNRRRGITSTAGSNPALSAFRSLLRAFQGSLRIS